MNNEQLKQDLNYVRQTMRKSMEIITSGDYTDKEKKNIIGIFNTLNNCAKILVSTYITEIANERVVNENSNILVLGCQNDESKTVDNK